jgi:Transposase, Mutator family
VMLAGFVLGLSTRKVGETLLSILGQAVSATTVSRVAKTLDTAVLAFHRRPAAKPLHGADARRGRARAQDRRCCAKFYSPGRQPSAAKADKMFVRTGRSRSGWG